MIKHPQDAQYFSKAQLLRFYKVTVNDEQSESEGFKPAGWYIWSHSLNKWCYLHRDSEERSGQTSYCGSPEKFKMHSQEWHKYVESKTGKSELTEMYNISEKTLIAAFKRMYEVGYVDGMKLPGFDKEQIEMAFQEAASYLTKDFINETLRWVKFIDKRDQS